MSDEQGQSRAESWRLRRIRRDERKESLPPSPPLFLPDENEQSNDQSTEEIALPPPDLSLLPSDDDALYHLTTAQDVVRPVKITPQAERYPPLAPDAGENVGSVPAPVISAGKRRKVRPHPQPPLQKQGGRAFYNFLAGFFLLATVGLCGFYTLIWAEPQSLLNPFPPEILYSYVTATPESALPSAPISVPPAPSTSLYPFSVVSDGIIYLPNGNGRGCDWASVAGVVVGLDGRPLNGYRVRVTDEAGTTETLFTGATLTFGEGGFEFPLSGAPLEATFTLQLFSPQDAPLSEPVTVSTQADCDANVVVVTFSEG